MERFCFYLLCVGSKTNKKTIDLMHKLLVTLHPVPQAGLHKRSQYLIFFILVWATAKRLLWETNKKVASGVALENDAQSKQAGHLNSAGRMGVLWTLWS